MPLNLAMCLCYYSEQGVAGKQAYFSNHLLDSKALYPGKFKP